MKHIKIFTLVLCLFSSYSYAKLSCDDLDGLAEGLDEVAEELSSKRSIRTGGKIDNALGELTDALSLVAAFEKDRRLTAWVTDLEIAWEDDEWEDFEESLDDVIERIDSILDRDCD